MVIVAGVYLPVVRAEPIPPPALAETLKTLVESEDLSSIRQYLLANRNEILHDADHVVLALILWRRLGDFSAAMDLAEEAQSRGLAGGRRLDFEMAISYWQNGFCARAVPLFQKLYRRSGPSADWMTKESARFLADCSARLSWRLFMETSFGYDTNLGNSVPQRLVAPESGSVIGVALDRLHFLQPGGDASPNVVIGTPARGGVWTEIAPYLEWRQPFRQGDLTVQIGSMARMASRREYHGQAHHLAGSYRYRVGRHTLSTSAAVRHDTESLGPERGHQWSSSQFLRISSASRIGRSFHLSAGVMGRKLKGMGDAHFSSRYNGVDLGLAFAGSSSPQRLGELGYRVSVMAGFEMATPKWSSGQHKGIALRLGPFMAGRIPLRVELKRDHKTFDEIRPWLRDSHDRMLDALTLTSTYSFVQGQPVRIEMEWHKSRSRDPVDQDESIKFSFHFNH